MPTQEDAPSPSGDDVLEGALCGTEDDGSLKCAEPVLSKSKEVRKKTRVRTPRKSLLEELEATTAKFTSAYNTLAAKYETHTRMLDEYKELMCKEQVLMCKDHKELVCEDDEYRDLVRKELVCNELVCKEQAELVSKEKVSVHADSMNVLEGEVRECEEAARSLDEILGSTTPVRSAKEARSMLVRWLHMDQRKRAVAATMTQVAAIIHELSATREMHQSRADLQAAGYDRDGNPAQQPGDAFEALSHVMNVNCSQKIMAAAEEVWAKEERPTPPPPGTYHVRLPCEELATIYASVDADETQTDEERETFFLSKEASPEGQSSDPTRHRVFQSMTMQLPLGGKNASAAEAVTFTAIVDSGAAWCAANAAEIRQHFPELWKLLRPSAKIFKDASDNPMPLVGTVEMAFWIGELRFVSTVYVFNNLGAPFLLGTNAMVSHDLVIAAKRQLIYSATHGHDPAVSAALTVERPAMPPPRAAGQSSVATGADSCYAQGQDGTPAECETLCSVSYDEPSRCVRAQLGADSATVECATRQVDALLLSRLTPRPCTILRSTHDVTVKPGAAAMPVMLAYDNPFEESGENTNEVDVHESFTTRFGPLGLVAPPHQLHSNFNAHAFIHFSNDGDDDIFVPHGTIVATARPLPPLRPARRANTVADVPPSGLDVSFRIATLELASCASWTRVAEPPVEARPLVHPALSTALAGKGNECTFSADQLSAMALPPVHCDHYVVTEDGATYKPAHSLPFKEGGRPTCAADLLELGFDLSNSIDPSKPKCEDGSYPPLSDERKQVLYDIALDHWSVWARDARTPALSRLVVLEIPTGDASPVAQRPYPVPYKYLEAVRAEVQKLLDGGLIEPCISNWASPTLVRLKKDSTPDNVKLKLVIDYRRLNEVTVPDAAGLGDQDEIIDGFGGDQRWGAIVDAAGGFYQFLIHPKDRHRTAFVLPTSMGGTSFQWRVAPYGLARNPAGYSRGMMFALKGLDNCALGPLGESRGGARSWIDDISMHANSFEGFADLFGRVLARMSFACMSLKASKCLLLHQKLEVLGYFITPYGIMMQPAKLDYKAD